MERYTKPSEQISNQPKVYSSPDELLQTVVTDYSDEPDMNETLEENLATLKKYLNTRKDNFSLVYVTCSQANLAVLEQSFQKVIVGQSIFLDLPENYSLSLGIWDLLKARVDQINTASDYVLCWVRGFTKSAANKKINRSQNYTHLYTQNTGEQPMNTVNNKILNPKSFRDKPFKVLVITLIDDSMGLEKKKEIQKATYLADFTDRIIIPD